MNFTATAAKNAKENGISIGEWFVTFSIHCRRKEDPTIGSIGATCDTVPGGIDDQSSFAPFAVKYLNE